MKKDYIPVKLVEMDLPERELIERYWTRVWQDVQVSQTYQVKIESSKEFRWIDPYLVQLPAGSRLLDGGCGLGDWSLYYARRGFDVFGMDISRDTVERLKSLHPDRHFIAGDIRNTGFADTYFDAYFSWGTFEHFESGMGAPLKEAWRILKPGGYLFISVPYQNRRHLHRERGKLWRWDESYDRQHGYAHPMRFYQWRFTKPELQCEMELNGFHLIGIHAIHKREGLRRTIQHDLGQPRQSWLAKGLLVMLSPFIPSNWVAHMLLAIGRKPN